MEHKLQAITIQQVEIEDPSEPVKLKTSEPRITAVGCMVCGMVLDEAIEVPSCPGRSVKDMINEAFED